MARSSRFAMTFRPLVLLVLLSTACDDTRARPDKDSAATRTAGRGVAADDGAFAAMQARGADPRGMGVDQYTSVHLFDTLPDGGRVELQRDTSDRAGVLQVRVHLQHLVAAFTRGDFSTPEFVHMQAVPGTAVMARRRAGLRYRYEELPGGGALRITSTNPGDTTVLRAVHAFIMFQRDEHHAGGH